VETQGGPKKGEGAVWGEVIRSEKKTEVWAVKRRGRREQRKLLGRKGLVLSRLLAGEKVTQNLVGRRTR